jgi:alcohol dehydrogenase class IV
VKSWVHVGYPQKIVFGTDSVDQVGAVVKEVGARRVLLVTTERGRSSEAGERVVRGLGRSLAAVFDGVRSHVPTSAVEAAVQLASESGADGIVSFGGGSCADLGKAVCFFTEQQAGMAPPHVSIPTTYSGAELTPFFGMTDEATRQKRGAGGPSLAPRAAIYDPVITLDMPVRVAAETGMNALAHGVECAYSPMRTPEAEAVALACVERVARALPAVIDAPADLAARALMLEGAVLGGRCLQNASMGVHHGLAQLLGGRTGIPHGLANAVLLAHALRFNAEAVPAEAAHIGAALGDEGDAAGAVDRLRERVGLPGRLSACGVTEEDVDAVARMALDNGNVRLNPRPVTEADARAILTAAF